MSLGEDYKSDKTKMEVSDEDTYDHSNNSEDESSDDEKLEKETNDLEKKIEQEPYNYNSHVELIKNLQKLADLEKLRKAREAMSKYFPLTPELWMSWLKDETNLATSNEERKNVVELFERAIQDYLSVDLWLEYAQFSIGNMGLQDGMKSVRDTFERALTAVGLHVARGAILWEAYREFENVMLVSMQPSSESDMGENQKEELDIQKKRIVTLFRRQLAVPLLDMEKTYQEFNEWLNQEPNRKDGVDIKLIEDGFKKALLKLSKILPFEEQLLSSDDASRPKHYRAYLEYEKSNKDPVRVICLFERAVADLCLDASMWLEYVEYIDSTLKIDSIVLPVCRRSVRNCPWSTALWQHYLRALERYEKPFEEVKEVMEQALSVGFNSAEDYRSLWLSYLEYMRRRVDCWSGDQEFKTALRATFNRACGHLAQYFGLEGDPNCELLQYWARIEASQCKDMEQFRLIWQDILSQGHDKTASMWLEYIQWERAFGDNKHLRKLFPRALTSTQDWPESIGNAWLNFERDEGNLESYETCISKYKISLIYMFSNFEGTLQHIHEAEGKWAGVAPKSVIAKPGPEPEIPKEKAAIPPPPGFDKRKRTADDDVEDSHTKKRKEDQPESEHGVTVTHDASKDNRTVFVSNLDFSLAEEKLRETFSCVGTLTDVRLVKDFKGRSKGYCYVEFSSQKEAEAALKKDRELIDGRPMFVSKCDTDKHTRKPGFKYSTSLEKNKLFIKGLPLSTTKDELEEIFKRYGSLKEVRIVTYRNGHSKGLAYVEFHDEWRKDAEALKRREELSKCSKLMKRRGRGRTQVSFLPRSLVVSTSATSTTPAPTAPSSTVTSASSESATNGDSKVSSKDARKPLSNTDFRDMLLGKK
ncbi:hypothetical protein C0J52_06406 [Blattella germanica]|nr:hypothetical protein C0J52_06406 [Blattella germanica]